MTKEQPVYSNLQFPVAVLSLTMALFFLFQMTQVMSDRSMINKTVQQLNEPYAASDKINKQFGGLVVGTRKLAEDGNASAKDLVKKLKQIGVLPADEAAPAANATVTPVPAASEKPVKGPVKP